MENFSSSLDLFYLDTGRYPTNSEGLAALAQRPANVESWNGPYVKGGRVPGEQIKVAQSTLFQNRDFPVLTDYRALFGGLFQRAYGLDQKLLQQVFPSVTPKDLALV